MKPYNKIFEARSHPSLNPKVSAYEALLPYKDREDVFITFTSAQKGRAIPVHVNPQSKYDTPIGIYCYPIKEFWEKYNVESTKSPGKSAPFAGDKPYIHVLQLERKAGFVNDMYSDYGSNDYDRDMNKLRELYGETKYPEKDIEHLANVIAARKITGTTTEKHIAFSSLHNYPPDKKTANLLKNMPYGLYMDMISDISHLTALTLRQPHSLKLNLNKYLRSDVDMLIEVGTKNAKVKNPITSMWNVTRLLAREKGGKSGAAAKWNKILRQLGYTGFADRSGRGIIHNAEPMQCVFVDPKGYEVIDMAWNKDYKNTIMNVIKRSLNNSKVVETALKSGLDPNEIDSGWVDELPLYHYIDNKVIAPILLKYGADPFKKTKRWDDPILQSLMNDLGDGKDWPISAIENLLKNVKTNIAKKLVNPKDADESYLLETLNLVQLFGSQPMLDLLKILLTYGANPNVMISFYEGDFKLRTHSPDGRTVSLLNYAKYGDYTTMDKIRKAMADLLQEYGALS